MHCLHYFYKELLVNQSQLDEILRKHRLWLESNQENGEQANFSNSFLNERYSNKNDVSTINMNELGGYSVSKGVSTYSDNGNIAGIIFQCFELDFSGQNLSLAIFKDSIFFKCNMQGVRFSNCDFSDAKFFQVNFTQAPFLIGMPNFSNVIMNRCIFKNNFIQSTDLTKCNFSGSEFKNCSFIGSDFAGSELYGVNLLRAV
jgi:uncharacterized protein YjbI with pentapeptide repeats